MSLSIFLRATREQSLLLCVSLSIFCELRAIMAIFHVCQYLFSSAQRTIIAIIIVIINFSSAMRDHGHLYVCHYQFFSTLSAIDHGHLVCVSVLIFLCVTHDHSLILSVSLLILCELRAIMAIFHVCLCLFSSAQRTIITIFYVCHHQFFSVLCAIMAISYVFHYQLSFTLSAIDHGHLVCVSVFRHASRVCVRHYQLFFTLSVTDNGHLVCVSVLIFFLGYARS